MLALDKPAGSLAGLTVFADHADPELFYYIPTRPRVAMIEGVPEVSYVKFRRDLSGTTVEEHRSLGVGMLSFTVELSASEDDVSQAIERLVERGANRPRLVPLPFVDGKAVLASVAARAPEIGPAGRDPNELVFFEEIMGTVMPDLAGTNRAMFALYVPNHEAASLVEQLLTSEAFSPLGVRYELTYLGLRPAVEARITADYSAVKDELDWGFGIGGSYYGSEVKVGVDNAVRKLQEVGAIQVEVTHFTDDATFKKHFDDALSWFQGRIVSDFFKPSMPPASGADALLDKVLAAIGQLGLGSLEDLLGNDAALSQVAGMLGISPDLIRGLRGGGGGGASGGESAFSIQLSFSYEKVHEETLKTLTFDLRESAAEKRIAAPQGLLRFMGVQGDSSATIRTIAFDESFWRNLSVTVQPVGDLAALGIERLAVHFDYPGSRPAETPPTETDTAVFPPDDPSRGDSTFAVWADTGDLSYRYRVEMHFAPDAPSVGRTAVVTGPWTVSWARKLLVNPLQSLDLHTVEIAGGGVDFDSVPHVMVELRQGSDEDAPRASFDLSRETPRHRWSVRLPPEGDRSIEARLTWAFTDGTPVTGAWTPVEGAAIMVPGPWRDARAVRLVPLLPVDFVDASVTVAVDEGPHHHEETIFFLPGDRKPVLVRIPTLSSPPPAARVDVVVIRADGSTWIQGTDGVEVPVLVVSDADVPTRRVEVRLLAPQTLVEVGLVAVHVQIVDALDPSVELDAALFTESRKDPVSLRVAEPAEGPFSYGVRTTRYDVHGEAHPSEVTAATTTTLMVPAVAAS